MNPLKLAPVAVVGVVGISILGGSFYTVNQTERGVLLRNGAVVGVAQPGFAFKAPFIDDVEKVPVTTSTWTWDKMNAYSYDQQPADLKVSVTLHASPDQVAKLYSKFGSIDNAVKAALSPIVNQQTKVVFGQYTAAKAVQERGKLNADIKDAIVKALADDAMLVVESVQLENVDFSPAYVKSIEDRMLAEVEVQKLQQNAAREKVQAQITVTKATAQADAVRAEAQAQADAIRLKGEAEATAIAARGKALIDNPSVVALTQAERWDGKLPATMVPGSSVPFISVK